MTPSSRSPAFFSDDDFELVPRPSMDSDLHDERDFDILSLGESTALPTDSDSEDTPESPSRAASAVIVALEDLHRDQLSNEIIKEAFASAQALLQDNAAPSLVAAAPAASPPQTSEVAPDVEPVPASSSGIASSTAADTVADAAPFTAAADLEPPSNSNAAPCSLATGSHTHLRGGRPTMLLVVVAYAVLLCAIRFFNPEAGPTLTTPGLSWFKNSHARAAVIVSSSITSTTSPHSYSFNNTGVQLQHQSVDSTASCNKPPVSFNSLATAAAPALAVCAAAVTNPQPSSSSSDSNGLKTGPAVNLMLACPVCTGEVLLNASGANRAAPKPREHAATATARMAAGRYNPLLECLVCWLTGDGNEQGAMQRSSVNSSSHQLGTRAVPLNSTCGESRATAFTAQNAIKTSAKPAPTNSTTAPNWLLQYMWPCQATRHQQQHLRRQRVRQQQQQSVLQLLQLYPALPARTQPAAYTPLPLLSYHTQQQQQQQRGGVGNTSNRMRVHNETAGVKGPGGVAAAAAAVVAAAVRRIAQPTKPVPLLYIPAPPCLSLGLQNPSAGKASGAQLAVSSTEVKPKVAGSNPAAISGVFGGLTLPMLPPLAYAPPAPPPPPLTAAAAAAMHALVKDDTAAAATASAAAAVGGGLTLPMLPPVCNVKQQQQGRWLCDGIVASSSSSSSMGLTLPMLPPISCSTCSTQLQVKTLSSGNGVAGLGHITLQQGGCTHVSQPRQQQQQQLAVQDGQLSGSSTSKDLATLQLPQWAMAAIAAAAADHNKSSSSSSSGGVRGEGWVSTWASFPMIPPFGSAAGTAAAAAEDGEAVSRSSSKPAVTGASTPELSTAEEQTSAELMASRCTLIHLLHKVDESARGMQQPLNTLLQLLATARSRSMQCNLPTSSADFDSKPQQPFVAIAAAATAARSLLVVGKQLQAAATSTAESSRSSSHHLGEKLQHEVQELCSAVGLSHREVQVKLAAGIFKQHAHKSTHVAAAVPCDTARAAAAAMAGPPRPGGSVQRVWGTGYEQYLPYQTPAVQATQGSSSSNKLHAPTTSADANALPNNGIAKRHPTAAAAVATRVGHSSSASYDTLWLLNPGWDKASALAAAAAAGDLSKAVGQLQELCQELVTAGVGTTGYDGIAKNENAAGGLMTDSSGAGLGHARLHYFHTN